MILQIQPTSRGLKSLEEQARSNMRIHIHKKLPFEYDKCLTALNSLQRKAWEISENPLTEEKTKVQALSLAKDRVINKLELITNATEVNDAMRFAHESKNKKIEPPQAKPVTGGDHTDSIHHDESGETITNTVF